jgi:uncharacterized membrane protein
MWRWLLGVGAEDGQGLRAQEVVWQGLARWPFLLLGGVLLTLLILHLYRGQGHRLARWRPWLMQVAKSAALLLLLATLLEPVLRAERVTLVKRALAVLVDDSLSMGIRDRYLSAEARQVVERSAAAPLLSESEPPSRLDVLKRLLADPALDPLAKLNQEFNVELFRFGDSFEELSPTQLPALPPKATSTDLGSAIRKALDAFQGRNLSAVVLLTDGQHNRGLDPVLAAEAAASQGVRLYPVGLGEPESRDIELTNLIGEDVVFADEEVPLYVKLRQTGFGGATVEVVLRRGEAEVARQAVTLSDAPEQTADLHFTPDLVGTHTYTVELLPQPGELLTTNNVLGKTFRVIDQAIRVLYVEEEPRWFWRFFTAAALRDKRLKLSMVLRSADPGLRRDPNYVAEFPQTREEMFAYDLVIFGDVNPEYFTPEQLSLLDEFVRSEGGGFLMVAGRRFSPGAWRGTPVEAVLPVEVGPQAPATPEGSTETALFRFTVTPEGKTSSVMRLAEDPEANQAQWEALPGLYWYAENVTRAKPAASVLATHEGEGGRNGPLPLVTVMQYGRGRSMFVGSDETWRWRQAGTDIFRRFWTQAVEYLSVVRLLGEARRVQLTADGSRYSVGDAIHLSARVLDETYQPVQAEKVQAVIQSEGGAQTSVELRGDSQHPGLFDGSFIAGEPGQYYAWVEGEEESGKAFFTVGPPSLEFASPAMNRELLEHVASAGGGKFYQADQLATLLSDLVHERREVSHRVETELWDAPVVLLLITILFCTEWLMRKRSDLP